MAPDADAPEKSQSATVNRCGAAVGIRAGEGQGAGASLGQRSSVTSAAVGKHVGDGDSVAIRIEDKPPGAEPSAGAGASGPGCMHLQKVGIVRRGNDRSAVEIDSSVLSGCCRRWMPW